MNALLKIATVASLCLVHTGCGTSEADEEHHAEHHRIVVTSPVKKDVTLIQQYVCQIHSRRHIEVCALEGGYLESIPVQEGQNVKKGELMFKIVPTLYEAKLNAEIAEAQREQIEYENTKRLFEQNVVSQQELAIVQARLAKAQAQVQLARAELNFTEIKAPFDGIIDRLLNQQGSLIAEGDVLTTLSDNSVMWVYFNVPEARYLEYKAELDQEQADNDEDGDADDDDEDDDDDVGADDTDDDEDHHATVARSKEELQVELILANGNKFPYPGKIGAIEADFNNETGNIAFRADFPNPGGLLRHGQTGTIRISHVAKNAIVIPQRATYEILARRYVFVVGEDGIAHQRDIVVESELDDIYLVKEGLTVNDKIVFEGVRQVHDGEKLEFEYLPPKAVFDSLKHKAE
jgi:membrane fusion protein (multidrug efflux system)